jgi:hypothetical protein
LGCHAGIAHRGDAAAATGRPSDGRQGRARPSDAAVGERVALRTLVPLAAAEYE